MSFLLRLCLGFIILAPSLATAQQTEVLEIPGDGAKLSGIGVISGWKCEADGDITVRFDDDDELTVTMVYGSERGDTKENEEGEIICGDTNNGFLAIFNWALLDDGEHTAVAYGNGVEFDRSTFEVATLGEEFVEDAAARLRVPNFPSSGEEAWFEWNESTQGLEMAQTLPLEDACELMPSLYPHIPDHQQTFPCSRACHCPALGVTSLMIRTWSPITFGSIALKAAAPTTPVRPHR